MNARYKRRLPGKRLGHLPINSEEYGSNMAADSNTREVSLLLRSVSFFVLLLHLTTQVQNIVENLCP